MRRAVIAVVLVLVVLPQGALANGRAPITNGVFFRPGSNTDIWVRTTFGLLVSHDDGCTFRWICEQNVGYGGIFDPHEAPLTGFVFGTPPPPRRCRVSALPTGCGRGLASRSRGRFPRDDRNEDGWYVSTDAVHFQPAPASLQFGCIGQRSDGKIFACGANWMPDFQALGQSSDGLAWEKVFRFVEMEGPVECPTGTPQADTCGPMWPAMQQQFGTTGSTCLNPPELTPDTTSTPGSGCCDAGGSSSGLLLGAAVAMVCRRRRPSKDHDAKRAESHRDAA